MANRAGCATENFIPGEHRYGGDDRYRQSWEYSSGRQTVGRGSGSLWRRAAIAYGEKVEFSGRCFGKAGADGHEMRVWFDHADGLTAKVGDAPEGFEIAGADRKYQTSDGEAWRAASVVVSSPEVAEPRYVRYGWKDVPTVNLYNKAGLPASPFSSEELLPGVN